MPRMEERQLLAFQSELRKLAAFPAGLAGAAVRAAPKVIQEAGQAAPAVPGALMRFGQRQLHSMTGWTPKGGLGSMNMAPSGAASSIPGFIRSVRDKGLGPSIAAGAKSQLTGSNIGEKALMVGLPALGVASALRNKGEDPYHPGSSKEENVGRQVGNLVGGLAAGPMPLAGSIVMGEAFGHAGALAGRGVHKVRSLLNPSNGLHPHGPFASNSSDLTGESGQSATSEKIVTDRAAGTHGSTL